jgi:hypothetical protein
MIVVAYLVLPHAQTMQYEYQDTAFERHAETQPVRCSTFSYHAKSNARRQLQSCTLRKNQVLYVCLAESTFVSRNMVK